MPCISILRQAERVQSSRIDLRACRFSMMISCSTAFVTFTITLRKPELTLLRSIAGAALASIWAIRVFVRLIACSGCSGIPRGFFAFSTSGEPNGYCFRYGAHVSDTDALEFAQALLKPYEPHHLKALPKGVRDDCIRKLKSEGFSIKQIVRLTGIGHCTIQKVKVEK